MLGCTSFEVSSLYLLWLVYYPVDNHCICWLPLLTFHFLQFLLDQTHDFRSQKFRASWNVIGFPGLVSSSFPTDDTNLLMIEIWLTFTTHLAMIFNSKLNSFDAHTGARRRIAIWDGDSWIHAFLFKLGGIYRFPTKLWGISISLGERQMKAPHWLSLN